MNRRNRKPTQYGTCQACGDVVALAASREPALILKHGYLVVGLRDRVPCAGSGYPPIEISRERGHALVDLYRQQLADLRTHGRDLAERIVPAGLNGAAALRARFTGQVAALPSKSDPSVAVKIVETEKRLKAVKDTLATGPSNTPRHRKAPATLRLNAMFRRSADQMMYIVEKAEAPLHVQMARNRRRAPTYICRNVDTGERVRLTQNELTRALNEQAGTVPLVRGQHASEVASSAA